MWICWILQVEPRFAAANIELKQNKQYSTFIKEEIQDEESFGLELKKEEIYVVLVFGCCRSRRGGGLSNFNSDEFERDAGYLYRIHNLG